MRAHRSAIITGLIVGMVTGGVALTPAGLDLEEELGLQWLFQLRGPVDAPSGVVIVDTADTFASAQAERNVTSDAFDCLDRVRRSPSRRQPRCIYAQLLDHLHEWGASVIVFDVFFGEDGDSADDEALTQAIARAGRVVLVERLVQDRVGPGNVIVETVHSPIRPFADVAAGLGPFPMPKVPARVSQFWTFKTGAGDIATLPAVALQVRTLPWLERVAAVTGVVPSRATNEGIRTPVGAGNAPELTRIMRQVRDLVSAARMTPDQLYRGVVASTRRDLNASERSQIDALARLYAGRKSYFLNFYGPPGTIRTIPVHAILDPRGTDAPDVRPAIRDSVVFVGQATPLALAQNDGHYTVYSRADGVDLSGVEIGATAYANLLNNQSLSRLNNLGTLAIVIAGCVLVAFGCYRRSPVMFAVVTLGVAGFYVAAPIILFIERGVWIQVIFPAAGQFVTIVVCLVLRGGFVHGPSRLVYGLYLLTDIVDYTGITWRFRPNRRSLTDRLLWRLGIRKSPVATALPQYFERLSSIIERSEGTVLDFADSTLSIWFLQEPHAIGSDGVLDEEHNKKARTRACEAALEIARNVAEFNEASQVYSNEGERLEFPTRIGMDLGLGEISYIRRASGTEVRLIGGPPNRSARLEQLNKSLGTQILVSLGVIKGLDNRFIARWVGTFLLRGEGEPVMVFELCKERNPEDRVPDAFYREFENALYRYAEVAKTLHTLPTARKEQWSGVVKILDELRKKRPDDGPTKFFFELAQKHATDTSTELSWPLTDPNDRE